MNIRKFDLRVFQSNRYLFLVINVKVEGEKLERREEVLITGCIQA
jgi:hypothetical protein